MKAQREKIDTNWNTRNSHGCRAQKILVVVVDRGPFGTSEFARSIDIPHRKTDSSPEYFFESIVHYLQIELLLLARDMEWANTIVLENTTTRVPVICS